MTYTYYFRECPDLTEPMPEGCTSLIFHRAPVWVDTLKCQVYGRAVYERKLSFRECLLHNLVEDGQRAEQPKPEPPEEKPGWISCSEKLPEEMDEVLLRFEENRAVGFFSDGFWCVNTGNGFYTELAEDEDHPNAWMPLPELLNSEGTARNGG